MENENPAPYYRYHVFACTNKRPPTHPMPSCGPKGGVDMFQHMRERVLELGLTGVRINSAGCLGRCDSAPVMVVYPEGIWYQLDTIENVDHIIADHFQSHNPPKHLMLGSE